VKVFRAFNRGDGQLVGLERDAGIAIIAPAWVLDASICAGFELGVPLVSTDALFELHSVLRHLGFRRGFMDDESPMEAPNETAEIPDTNPIAAALDAGPVTDGTGAPVDGDGSGATASDCGASRSGRAQ
jgi:hypothetical protein